MPMQPIPPPLVEPDEPRCVCISVNESWAVLLLGAVHKMQYPDYWGGSLEENRLARRQAKNLMAIISEAIQMGCCCDDRTQIPRRERYTSDGRLEVSYDGGETWENGDNFDPRFNSPVWPPLYTTEGQDVKCIAAHNAYAVLKELIDKVTAEQNITVSAIATIIVAVISGLIIGATVGTGWALAAWLAGLILQAAQLGLQNVFTLTEWGKVLCILYCNTGEDGSFTTEQWQAIKDEIGVQFVWPARDILLGQIDLLGPVGLTNAGRKQSASPTVTCEDCNCGDGWCAKWYVGGPLQFIYSTFIAIDGIGVPPNPFEWNGNTVYEYKIGATVPNRLITQVTVEFQNSAAGVQGAAWNDSDFSPFPGYAAASITGNKVIFPVNTFCNQGLVILIESNSNPGHIVSVTVEGEDTNPYGEDNC